MSFGGGRMGIRPGEYTKVGLETEVKIPWETYKKLLILGPVSIWCVGWIPSWLIWLRVEMESMSMWRWLSREWWPWASGGGIIWPILMCFVWWGSAPTWETIRRYFIETRYKKTPEYMPWNPENGPWSPGAHKRLRSGDEEFDQSTDALSPEDQPYIVRGEMRTGDRSVLYLEFELEDYAAALKWHKFCQAVDGGKKFSYNEAVRRHKLSRRDWKRIYKAFTAQHWATKAPRRGTSELMAVGKHWIKIYAKNPPLAPLP